jgi:hypothetical protein
MIKGLFTGKDVSKRVEEQEWEGMPEFVQKDLTSFHTITVHFRNREDIDDFAKLIDQRVSPDTKYLYFPKEEKIPGMNKKYVDTPVTEKKN